MIITDLSELQSDRVVKSGGEAYTPLPGQARSGLTLTPKYSQTTGTTAIHFYEEYRKPDNAFETEENEAVKMKTESKARDGVRLSLLPK